MEEVNPKEWNENLRIVRKGQTLQDVATRAGVASSTVANLEQGNGTIYNLVRVAILGLGVRPGELFPD